MIQNIPYNQNFFNNIAAEFDSHVQQSIPLFFQFQSYISGFIAEKFSNSNILDICGSTGELGRKLLLSGWNGFYNCVDGSPQMRDVFNAVTPEGSKSQLSFELSGFGGGWSEDYNGQKISIPTWLNGGVNYNLAIEILGFQFFTKDRFNQISLMKQQAKSCLFFEKFSTQNQKLWSDNERLKNTLHKSNFFSADQINQKQIEVLDDMGDYLFDQNSFETILDSEFLHVVKVAQMGNFAGYFCTNDITKLPNSTNKFLLNNKFNA